ncbi:hypothetical protein [Enhygromyxa salina]|uniref:Uncharacterized protein n=1 Tax=Enhygromyxa salina TaxID=215803 RepID=A0A2S9YP70_9BACT|nr:hypothetical protein [Enhygromyxa salina]PRQ06895.1 hypothetical protein ENSA7_34330 [Enhygromyxa salina]
MLVFGALLLLLSPPAPLHDAPEPAPVEQRSADQLDPASAEVLPLPAAPPSDPTPAWVEPPPPELIQSEPPDPFVEPPVRPRRTQRCLPEVDPCVHTMSARLLLAGLGAISTAAAVVLVFQAGDRGQIGDPAMAIAGAGVIAMGGASIGGIVGVLGRDGPTLPDRITPATVALSLALGGSDHTDESVPYGLSGSIAPTWSFPRDRGRLRLIGSVGGNLGNQLERDPRPQTQDPDGSFATALERHGWRFDLGLDLAVRLPYPLAQRRPGWLGQLELRYKPLVLFAHDSLTLGEEPRISQRLALIPLNFGVRWHISPRQRFTFYMSPRWDLNGYGEPGNVPLGRFTPAPIYAESWFDLDIPLRKLASAGRPAVIGQYTVGYVHSRFYGEGMNFGSVVGFLGQVATQFAVRVRPLGSPVAYQFELGARVGGGLNPYARVGLVLPNFGGPRQ